MFGKKHLDIAIDGGGFCTDPHNKFGNYTFTENIIHALSLYDKKNLYTIYSFCQKPADLVLSRDWNYKHLLPKRLWMKIRVSVEELFQPRDIFLALNQAVPLYTRSKVISFCHGLSYFYFPKLYKDSYNRLSSQLESMLKRSDYIVVSSIKVKNELQEIYPKNKNVAVIPYGVPFDMNITNSERSRRNGNGRYFLYVGMDHPIKNIGFIKEAFEKFRKNKKYKDYRLICISGGAAREELKKLYQEATAYLTASHYESFNLTVLEALSQNCPVIGLKSAIIPELLPYISTAASENDFVKLMVAVSEGKTIKIDRNILHKRFSWREYVKKLNNLY